MAFKETLTPILGDAAISYDPEYETSAEFMNGKFKELLENDVELLKQINVLEDNMSNTFSSSVTVYDQAQDVLSIPKSGIYLCVPTNLNIPSSDYFYIIASVWANTDKQFFAMGTMSKTCYVGTIAGGVFQGWQQIATMTQVQAMIDAAIA